VVSSEDNRSPDPGRTWYVFIPLGAALIVYINSFRGAFQLDDYNVIVFNSAVHSWSAFGKQFFPGIRPLLKLTYALNWTSSAGVFGFHVFNLAIHLITTLLVYNLTVSFVKECRTGLPQNALYPAAILTAVLFALHPVQTEAVTYISGRSASMMTMFCLGSLAAYVKGSREGKKTWLYFLSPLLFLMGAATKEYAITLPFALVLYEACAGGLRPVKRTLSRQWVHWVLFAAIIAMVLSHPRYRFILLYSFGLRGFTENLLGQAAAVGEVLSHVFLPNRLNIDPGELPASSSFSIQTAVLIILGVVGIAGMIRRKAWLVFGISWFFLSIAMVVLVPRIDGISDRHFYHASWGMFLAGAVIITSLFFRRFKSFKAFAVLVACISVLLGSFTVMRNHVYRSEVALWEDTVKKSPSNARAYNNLGYAYFLANRPADAQRAYLKAIEIDPGLEHAVNNLQMLGPHTTATPQRSD
jgi:protein O-mannosyl-transferase